MTTQKDLEAKAQMAEQSLRDYSEAFKSSAHTTPNVSLINALKETLEHLTASSTEALETFGSLEPKTILPKPKRSLKASSERVMEKHDKALKALAK